MADDINISPEMVNNLLNMLKTSTDSKFSENDNNSENKQNDTSANIDFDTILKIKSIMEAFNSKDDPDFNLLYSLKPYLRKSRQEKIDQYANILKLSHISKIFKQK